MSIRVKEWIGGESKEIRNEVWSCKEFGREGRKKIGRKFKEWPGLRKGIFKGHKKLLLSVEPWGVLYSLRTNSKFSNCSQYLSSSEFQPRSLLRQGGQGWGWVEESTIRRRTLKRIQQEVQWVTKRDLIFSHVAGAPFLFRQEPYVSIIGANIQFRGTLLKYWGKGLGEKLSGEEFT